MSEERAVLSMQIYADEDRGCVEITWNVRIDPDDDEALHDALFNALDDIEGVEAVMLDRYSADVFSAGHIRDLDDLAIEIERVLNNDDRIYEVMAERFKDGLVTRIVPPDEGAVPAGV